MKLHKYIVIAAGLALTAGFTACDEGGNVEYTPATTPTGSQIYFSADNADMEISLTNGQTEVQIPIYRVDASEADAVQLSFASESSVLSLADNTVTFDKDQKEATVVLNVDFDAIEANTTYSFTISIPADDASLYSIASLNGTVVYAPWSEWTKFGTGNYEYSLYFNGDDPGLDVMWRQSLIDDTKVEFQILHWGYDVTLTIEGTKTTAQDGSSYYILTVPETGIGYINTNYNEEVLVSDIFTYTGNSRYQDYSVFDPSTGEFDLCLVYYISLGVFNNGYEYFQLDGYTTYTITLSDQGHYVDKSGTDYAVVQCHLSDGIASAKYTAVEGSLTESEIETVVDGIIDGSIDSGETTESNGFLTFSLPDQGMYTVVVVGFDADGKEVAISAIVLAYVPVGSSNSVDDDPDWTTLGYCTYTDDFVTTFFNVGNESVDVKIQQSKGNANAYRLVNAYAEGLYPAYVSDATKNYFLNFEVLDNAGHTVLPSIDDQGVDLAGYGNIYTYSIAGNLLDEGTAAVIASGYCGVLDSGFLTFPTKSLLVAMANYQNSAFYYANMNGAFEVDMSNITSQSSKKKASSKFRTSLNLRERVYGDPVHVTKVVKKSFIGKVTSKEVIASRIKQLKNIK